MDYRITQCPRCGTSFRVTDAHLAVAAGAVRCGSCLHIFNAREHWIEERTAAEEQPATVLHTDQIDDDTLIDDDILIDDDSPLLGDEGDGDETRPRFDPAGNGFGDDLAGTADGPSFLDNNSWEPELKPDFGAGETFGDEAGNGDESWAEKLLEEDPLAPFDESLPLNDRFSEFDDILAQAPEAEERHDEPDLPDISPEFLELGSPAGRHTETDTSPTTADDLFDTAAGAGEITSRADDHTGEPALRADEPIARGGRGLLGGFEPEPLQLHQFVREPRWPRLLWGLGLVAALALLVFQYLHFNFDRLARGETRPWIARLCSVAGCQLPAQYDLPAIRTGSLIVRSHPTRRGALAVDAILTNTAAFGQPYPNLLLQFTDLNGEPVAGRIFKAEEYLGGELSGTRLMPLQQPVHIGLEVLDPGPRAVNYQLTVTAGQ